MYDKKGLEKWPESYWNHIKRNIGLIRIVEQEKLRTNLIVIFGVGGLGGPLVEQLVRTGCENIVICDYDKFVESNLNRQLCLREDIGKFKIDVLAKLLKKINTKIKIQKFYEINEENISNILKNATVAALTLDDPITSILISRECVKKDIPILEAWAIPYLCTWWFTQESIDYESCYDLDTKGISFKQLKESKEIILDVRKALLPKLLKFPGIRETYDREEGAVEGLFSGKLPSISLAPIVRMTASFLAFEIIFSGILKVKEMVLAPNVIGYDYFQMKPINFSFL
ncbi:MAG: ThiF family adenylyltransferase [Promethearchaeota archaeon]